MSFGIQLVLTNSKWKRWFSAFGVCFPSRWIVAVHGEKNSFTFFYCFIQRFIAFGGAICRIFHYAVGWEKPPPQNVVCQRRGGRVDFRILGGLSKNEWAGFLLPCLPHKVGHYYKPKFLFLVLFFFAQSWNSGRSHYMKEICSCHIDLVLWCSYYVRLTAYL